MPCCAMGNCSNYSKKTKGQGIIYHSFPDDPNIANVWVLKCRRKDKINTRTASICSEHFPPDNYMRDLKAELLGTKPRKVLKPTAVPEIKPALDPCFPVSPLRKEGSKLFSRSIHKSLPKHNSKVRNTSDGTNSNSSQHNLHVEEVQTVLKKPPPVESTEPLSTRFMNNTISKLPYKKMLKFRAEASMKLCESNAPFISNSRVDNNATKSDSVRENVSSPHISRDLFDAISDLGDNVIDEIINLPIPSPSNQLQSISNSGYDSPYLNRSVCDAIGLLSNKPRNKNCSTENSVKAEGRLEELFNHYHKKKRCNKSVQTLYDMYDPKNLLNRIRWLEYKVQTLKNAITNRDTKIRNLRSSIVMTKKSVNSDVHEILGKIFTPSQIRSIITGKRCRNWSNKTLEQALTLREISKKAYIFLRKNMGFPLPGIATIKRYQDFLKFKS